MSAMKAEAEEIESEMHAEFSQQKDETRDKVFWCFGASFYEGGSSFRRENQPRHMYSC